MPINSRPKTIIQPAGNKGIKCRIRPKTTKKNPKGFLSLDKILLIIIKIHLNKHIGVKFSTKLLN